MLATWQHVREFYRCTNNNKVWIWNAILRWLNALIVVAKILLANGWFVMASIAVQKETTSTKPALITISLHYFITPKRIVPASYPFGSAALAENCCRCLPEMTNDSTSAISVAHGNNAKRRRDNESTSAPRRRLPTATEKKPRSWLNVITNRLTGETPGLPRRPRII